MLRLAVVALVLLVAGCTSPAADPPAPALQRHVWAGATYAKECLNADCSAYDPVYPVPYEIQRVGDRLWLNLTWIATDPENEELRLLVDAVGASTPPVEFQGPSPLRVLVNGPASFFEVQVRFVERPPIALLFSDPPAEQGYLLEAVHDDLHAK